jgi:DNA polymerase-1
MYLVDAHSLIFQVFHAISAMSSPTGLPTNALFGFTRDLFFLREKKPDYLVIVFDPPGPVFRNTIYPDYKAHRPPVDNDLLLQMPHFGELVNAFGLPNVSREGFEADDVLATIARAADRRGLDVFICTSDKDCRQLLSDRVRMYSLRKHQEFGPSDLLADWGVKPEQVVDFQALVGDSVDNVPGVPGVGEKTAARLLNQFGTLENLLAHVDDISQPKLRENLRSSLQRIALSRQLVQLEDQVPIEMDWEAWRLGEWNAPRLLELFGQWNFRRFAEQVRAASPNGSTRPAAVAGDLRQARLFADDDEFPFGANSPAAELGAAASTAAAQTGAGTNGAAHVYHLVDTEPAFERFLAELKQQKRFAIDLETTSLESLRADIVGMAFCWKPQEAWYLAVRGPEGCPRLDERSTLAALKPLLEDPRIAKINQNIKYDWLVLRSQGIEVRGVAGDSMVADYLLNPGALSHNLDELSLRHLDHRCIPITDLIGKKGKNQKRMDEVPTERVAEYAGEDADIAWRITDLLERRLDSAELKSLYDEVEVPLVAVLAEMQYHGIRLDLKRLRTQGDEMGRRLQEIETEIHRLAGCEFNINSLPQLRKVLFDDLKLPIKRRTGIKGEPSTDQETLEWLAANEGLANRELPRQLLEYRQISKLKSTYVDALPELVNPRTGRIHTQFNQTVAETGRLSSSEPNLQNVPIRSDQGGQIRQAFIPEGGWVLLTADYSQIELRLLAHFSGDDALRQAFAEERDVHSAVAAQVFGVAEKDVAPAMRRLAKTINFGVIYGMSAHGLSERLKIPLDEAQRFIEAYFARYPKVLGYQTRLLEKCRKAGFVSTILGRRREISGVRASSTYQQRNQPEREAINMEIQGSAADLIKLAMLAIDARLRRERLQSRMLLTVHDELVFESPPEELRMLAGLVREEMTKPLERRLKLEVPLRVDLSVGPNWLDCEEFEEENGVSYPPLEEKPSKASKAVAEIGPSVSPA